MSDFCNFFHIFEFEVHHLNKLRDKTNLFCLYNFKNSFFRQNVFIHLIIYQTRCMNDQKIIFERNY